jgi:hypothetical protein
MRVKKTMTSGKAKSALARWAKGMIRRHRRVLVAGYDGGFDSRSWWKDNSEAEIVLYVDTDSKSGYPAPISRYYPAPPVRKHR